MRTRNRIDEQIKRLERELEQPISSERRRQIQAAINHLKQQKQNWQRPH